MSALFPLSTVFLILVNRRVLLFEDVLSNGVFLLVVCSPRPDAADKEREDKHQKHLDKGEGQDKGGKAGWAKLKTHMSSSSLVPIQVCAHPAASLLPVCVMPDVLSFSVCHVVYCVPTRE